MLPISITKLSVLLMLLGPSEGFLMLSGGLVRSPLLHAVCCRAAPCAARGGARIAVMAGRGFGEGSKGSGSRGEDRRGGDARGELT
eukprot:362704-Hanusia_phi.AAC.2